MGFGLLGAMSLGTTSMMEVKRTPTSAHHEDGTDVSKDRQPVASLPKFREPKCVLKLGGLEVVSSRRCSRNAGPDAAQPKAKHI